METRRGSRLRPFRSVVACRSSEITKAIYGRVPVLINRNRKDGGNPWGVRFVTMFHQTNDAELFTTGEELKVKRYHLEGNRWVHGKKVYLPLYEAKMVQAYDHRAASVEVVEARATPRTDHRPHSRGIPEPRTRRHAPMVGE